MKQYNTTVSLKYGNDSFAITNDPIVWAQAHTGQNIYAHDYSEGHNLFIPRHNIGHIVFSTSEAETAPPFDEFCAPVRSGETG